MSLHLMLDLKSQCTDIKKRLNTILCSQTFKVLMLITREEDDFLVFH